MFCRPYVSEDGAVKLKLYKYQGGDTSFLYKHLYNPLALYMVEHFTPEWLAPNCITLVGFMCTVVPFVLLFSMFGV